VVLRADVVLVAVFLPVAVRVVAMMVLLNWSQYAHFGRRNGSH